MTDADRHERAELLRIAYYCACTCFECVEERHANERSRMTDLFGRAEIYVAPRPGDAASTRHSRLLQDALLRRLAPAPAGPLAGEARDRYASAAWAWQMLGLLAWLLRWAAPVAQDDAGAQRFALLEVD